MVQKEIDQARYNNPVISPGFMRCMTLLGMDAACYYAGNSVQSAIIPSLAAGITGFGLWKLGRWMMKVTTDKNQYLLESFDAKKVDPFNRQNELNIEQQILVSKLKAIPTLNNVNAVAEVVSAPAAFWYGYYQANDQHSIASMVLGVGSLLVGLRIHTRVEQIHKSSEILLSKLYSTAPNIKG
jgi:hypothetical protein